MKSVIRRVIVLYILFNQIPTHYSSVLKTTSTLRESSESRTPTSHHYMYFLTFSIKFNSAIKKGRLQASDFKMVVKERGFPVKTAGKLTL